MSRTCFLFFAVGLCVAYAFPMTGEGGQTGVDEAPRDSNPVFNVWEFAHVYDGNVGVRASTGNVNSGNSGNNACLWAIVSCCGAQSAYSRDNCFDTLGCPGAWFDNLCSQDLQNAAHTEVSQLLSFG